MSYKRISLDVADDIATLTLNHPEAMNAIGSAMLSEIGDAVARLSDGRIQARCLLLTGAGRGFCAGANLNDMEAGESPSSGLRGGYHPVFLSLRDLEMPIVSAVNGAAAGVGMSFALSADLVCASRQAYFLQAFAKIGLVPDGGSTYLLPRLIGMAKALELSMLAERLPADQALEWGLINRVYDDNESLMAGARELAGRLAQGPRSLALIRKAYWASLDNSYEQQLDLEAQLQSQASRSADSAEGVAAFLEKRPVRFTGR